MSKIKIIKIAGMGLVIVLFVAGSTLVLAAGPKNIKGFVKKRGVGGPVIMGTVASINGTSINLNDKSGTVYSIDLSQAKILKEPGNTQIQVNSIQPGDTLLVKGTVNGANVAASTVFDGLTQRIQLKTKRYNGTVSAINGTSFTLQMKVRKNSTKTLTINTASSTAFTKNGQADSFSDLAVGQAVSVQGPLDSLSSSTIDATGVNIIIRMFPIRFNGTVQSVSGNILTILASYGKTYTVDMTNARINYSNGNKATSYIIQNNDQVIVLGRHLSGSNNITAVSIRDSSQKPQ